MTAKYATPALRAAFAEWGRRKHLAPPTSEAQIRVLFGQFIADMQNAVAATNIGAAGDNVYDGDPLQVAEQKITMLRNSGGLIDITEPETEDSDFGDLVRQRQHAMEEAGGDDLAAAAIVKGQNKAAANANSPSVNTNPLSAIDSILGSQVVLSLPANYAPPVWSANGYPFCGGPTQVASWTDDNQHTRVIDVEFGAVGALPSVFGVPNFRPIGIVQYGTSGYLLTAQVDIGKGCKFTVNGSQVILSVAIEGDTAGNPTNIPFNYTLTGMLSFGLGYHQQPVTRTIYFPGGAGQGIIGSQIINVPFSAKTFYLWRWPITEPVTINLLSDNGTAVGQVPIAANQIQNMPYLLPGDISQLSINSGDSSGINYARVVFELVL